MPITKAYNWAKGEIEETVTGVKKLVTESKKALKNSFKAKPAPGKKYLQDLEIGSVFKVFLLTGILVETTPTAAKVIIIDSKHPDSDNDYYLGKQSIALTTEVTEVNL